MQSSTGGGGGGGGSGGDGGGGNGNELGRMGGGGGLARFRSAPATWLDILLDDDLTRDDSLRIGPNSNNPGGGLTDLLTSGTAAAIARSNSSSSSYNISTTAAVPAIFDAPSSAGGSGPPQPYPSTSSGASFHRMNSSPAEFLSNNVDSYFSSFGEFPESYDLLSGAQPPGMEISPPPPQPPSSSGGKRMREGDTDFSSPSKFQLKRELSTGGSSNLLEFEMDKLFEDSVPCKVRAKRGFATHPRSIAERVRRTKISDRIRKLQELVPNMDKQTNTADMLEEAVEYVKRLQMQIQELKEQQDRCNCAAKN